jgi:hypothetical protein
LQISKNELEVKLRDLNLNLEQSDKTVKVATDEITNWRSKFKDFNGKLNEAEKIELKIRKKGFENKDLSN